MPVTIRDGMIKEGSNRRSTSSRRYSSWTAAVWLSETALPATPTKHRYPRTKRRKETGTTHAKKLQLMDVVENGKPTVLLGLTGIQGPVQLPYYSRPHGMAIQNAPSSSHYPQPNRNRRSPARRHHSLDAQQSASARLFDDVLYGEGRPPIGQAKQRRSVLDWQIILGACTRITSNMVLNWPHRCLIAPTGAGMTSQHWNRSISQTAGSEGEAARGTTQAIEEQRIAT